MNWTLKIRPRDGQKMATGILLAMLMGLFAGCQWLGFTNHVTPQVSGRVLAADTRQPLAGVRVDRGQRGPPVAPEPPANGAQLLVQEKPVITDAHGQFIFPSRNYLTLWRGATWWSLRLSFQAAGYIPVQTNFTAAQVTGQTPEDIPVINAGDILLTPAKQ